MKITFTKINQAQHRVSIERDALSTEAVILQSDTYFLHDLCHYVVEQELLLSDGFWGMLNKGHSFAELGGKTNPLTEELRKIECIVGGLQAMYLGHQTKAGYLNYLSSVDIKLADTTFIERALTKIEVLYTKFKYLQIGSEFTLHFVVAQ